MLLSCPGDATRSSARASTKVLVWLTDTTLRLAAKGDTSVSGTVQLSYAGDDRLQGHTTTLERSVGGVLTT